MKGKSKNLENMFISNADKLLLTKFDDCNGKHSCRCVSILYEAMLAWIKSSAFILTVSSTDNFCKWCLNRIVEEFRKYKSSCCSSDEGHCSCLDSCSPMTLLLDCFKFYAAEVVPEIGMCTRGSCEGFRDLNLQSLALKTYAVLAITQNIQYLDQMNNISSNISRDCNEEGDPIRVKVTKKFEDILTGKVDDVRRILQDLSGVKQVHIDGSTEKNGYYILVQSIGRAFNRWNLEEIIMDPKCPSIIETRLK